MAHILVLGADGQLGRELRRASAPPEFRLSFSRRADIDILSTEAPAAVAALRPDAIINAAAYTAVDGAEAEPELAYALNRDAPAALANVASRIGALFLHISTDYVFRGDIVGSYVETDDKAPLNVYGRSKAEGEDAVLANNAEAIILRTSWLYSPFRANFVKSMLSLGEAQREVRVVDDQTGRPTAASDLAAACVALVEHRLAGNDLAKGVFHFAGAGEASWADFAEAIFSEAAIHGRSPKRVARISTVDFPSAAIRPANSRLDTTKIATVLGIVPRPWRASLTECVAELLRASPQTA